MPRKKKDPSAPAKPKREPKAAAPKVEAPAADSPAVDPEAAKPPVVAEAPAKKAKAGPRVERAYYEPYKRDAYEVHYSVDGEAKVERGFVSEQDALAHAEAQGL